MTAAVTYKDSFSGSTFVSATSNFQLFSVAQTVFTKLIIPPLDELVSIGNKPPLQRRVCLVETDPDVVDKVH